MTSALHPRRAAIAALAAACCGLVGCGRHTDSLDTQSLGAASPAAAGGAGAAAPAKPPVRTLLDSDCGAAGAGGFDLSHVTITAQGAAVTVAAAYTGDPAGHDIVIQFPVGNEGQVVEAERFEDGSAVARVLDPLSGDSTFVDTPFSITAGAVAVTVGPDALRPSAAQVAGTTVTMSADGQSVESCP